MAIISSFEEEACFLGIFFRFSWQSYGFNEFICFVYSFIFFTFKDM